MDEPSLAVDMPGLLQAEEAQKLRLLRKRMKAESLRLLDMERRQKQRVEEIREVQKQVCNLTFLFTEITNYCYLLPSIALALMLFEHINNLLSLLPNPNQLVLATETFLSRLCSVKGSW